MIRKALMSWIVVALLVTPITTAAVDNVAGVSITGPDKVQPGQLAQFLVTGMSDEALNVAVVDWSPSENVTVIPAKTWGGQAMILFQPPATGAAVKYDLWIAWPYKQGDQICQGYLKTSVQVGDAGPPIPPKPPKPVNPYPKPDAKWLETLKPLSEAVKTSGLQFLKSKQAGEKLETVASQLTAGALTDNAQLFQAIRQAGSGSGLGKQVADALGQVMEVQNPHTEKLDAEQAAWTLRYMAWCLWENSIMEGEVK